MKAISIDYLPNGLAVVVESMGHVRSVSYDLAIPSGALLDDDGHIGASAVLQELITRGARGMSAFELSNKFDEAGVVHGEGCGFDRASFSGSLLPDSLGTAFNLVAAMLFEPNLDEEEIPNICSVFQQDISSITDSPARHASMGFEQVFFPEPFSRPSCGRLADLQNISGSSLRALWQKRYRPNGAVLSVAGNITREVVLKLAEQYFGDWKGDAGKRPPFTALRTGAAAHIRSQSEQVQLFIGYPGAKFLDPHYYAARVLNVILSGGMFGRLFVEVREKRGLCYSVHSSHAGFNEYGYVRAYAGTTPDRAATTLEVLQAELNAVPGTIKEEELTRAKANLKASLVMNLETPAARAGANLIEWWMRRSVRALDEIEQKISAVDTRAIDAYVAAYPPSAATVVTLGPEPLVSGAVETTVVL
jgi:predicted Zn-dependent peptidase